MINHTQANTNQLSTAKQQYNILDIKAGIETNTGRLPSSIKWQLGPRPGDMSILTDISSNNRLAIVMEPVDPLQAEGRVQVPSLLARAEGTIQVDPAPIPVVYRPPNHRPLEILEHPTEEHVIPLLLDVDAPRPVADVQAVPSEPARKQLIPLFPAQIPNPGCQMRPHRPPNLPPLADIDISILLHVTSFHSHILILILIPIPQLHTLLGLGRIVNSIKVQIIVQRPRTTIDGFWILTAITGGGGGRVGLGAIRSGKILVGAELALEAEVGVLEEDAGVAEAGAADGEPVEGGPAAGGQGGGGGVGGVGEVGDDGGDVGAALGLPADVADQGGELGADAGEAGPVPGVVLELGEDVEDDVVGEAREQGVRHLGSLVFLSGVVGSGGS